MLTSQQIKLIDYSINVKDYKNINNFKFLLERLISSKHKLHVFPEFFLLPLLFFYETNFKNTELFNQIKKYLRKNKRKILFTSLRYRTNLSWAFIIYRTQKIFPHITEIISKLAHKNQTFIYTWTWFSPFRDWEPIKDWYMPLGNKILNIGYLFWETWTLIGNSTKQRITIQEKKLNISSTPRFSNTFTTSIWKIWVLTCYDGFHKNLISDMDTKWVEILLRPSANNTNRNWHWTGGKWLTEKQAWQKYGASAYIKNFENIKILARVMLKGKLGNNIFEGENKVFCKN